ncbi:MAG: hypothetical protein H6Q26_3303 [Bacteroidetes bacterium]|nr:hypothetical protein [Bacteroidota bacterium]
MTKTVTGLLLALLLATHVNAQHNAAKKEVRVALQAANWEYQPDAVEFLTYKSVPTLKITGKGLVILKDLDFKDGTIEFDMEPIDKSFTSFYFRRSSNNESECFYFRLFKAPNIDAEDAIQYAPIIKGVNLWDMLYQYQRNAMIDTSGWNHVKLVISGKQMRVFVNGRMDMPLEIPYLEGTNDHGGLAFEGHAIFANLILKPDQVEGLSPWPGTDITDNDARYLRKWQISQVINMPEKIDFNYALLPDKTTVWDTIRAERRGLINLTRKYGGAAMGPRRVTFLKTTIYANSPQKKQLHLGFSDEIYVFINGQPLYMDKNLYGTPLMKGPDGRCTIDNTSFGLPLAQGANELLIGVANNFYGWGIIAQLDNLNGVSIER